ncbi:ATP-grasp domain-containing protein [Chryseobacterium sp. A321]
MKKIGILFGMEDSFPWAFLERIKTLSKGEVLAEPVKIDQLEQGKDYGYSVIVDRISHDVPFYKASLKNAAALGTYVINNPFWSSADEKFFNNTLMTTLSIPVPKTMLLPSHKRPVNTSETSFRNLSYPLDWESIFNRIGFPCYLKPHDGGGWRNVYRLESREEFWTFYGQTDELVMMLQEEIEFDSYFRVYCVGQTYVHIMPYEPKNEPSSRYLTHQVFSKDTHPELYAQLVDLTLRINRALGYDFNTVEFAIRDGIPYAIDFCNPAPDADQTRVGDQNFEWVVEHVAKFALEKANLHREGKPFIPWGEFVKDSLKDF